MKIKDLLKEQDDITAKDQLLYQAIIKKHLKKYGLDRNKDKELKDELNKHAKQLVTRAIDLGVKWLR